MTSERIDRFATISGLLSLILFFIAWFIYGDGPTVADEPGKVHQFFVENYSSVIWSMFIQGLGTLAMILFMSILVMAVYNARESALAVATALSFAVALALGAAATIIRSGIAFISIGDVAPETVTLIFHLGSVMDTCQNIISSGFFLAVALAILRTGFLPRWWGWVSVLAGLWAIASTTALNHGGFWSPDGAGFINLVFYILWVGGTSLLMLKHPREPAAA